MKKFTTLMVLVVCTFAFSACAHIREAVVPLLPSLEGKVEAFGLGIEVDQENLGINNFCIDPNGRTQEWLDKIPFGLGDYVAEDFVGVCEVEVPDELPEF